MTNTPQIISSQGIGSCVVVTIYDPYRIIGGMTQIMLAESHIAHSATAPQDKPELLGSVKRYILNPFHNSPLPPFHIYSSNIKYYPDKSKLHKMLPIYGIIG